MADEATCTACDGALPPSGVFCPHCGALRPPKPPAESKPAKAKVEPAEKTGETHVLDDVAFSPGDVVLDYRLERELGAGGMGSVWLGRHKVSDQAVAVKILPAALARDREVRERFLQEAKALAKLDHPCIVPLVTFSSRNDEHFLVMKYVDGASVQGFIEEHTTLTFEDVRRITRDVLAALGYAHERGVIHRDIKPGNVLVAHDGRTFLADFGIAKQEAGAKLTQTGMLMGTPQYMAPEQISGGAVTNRTDLYGLGLLVYEMLTGAPPFDFGKTFAILKAHLESLVPHPERRRREEIPVDLMTLMGALLQKDPQRRPASAEACLAILDDPKTAPEFITPFDTFNEMSLPPATTVEEQEFFEKRTGSHTPVTQSTPNVVHTEDKPLINAGQGPLAIAERGSRLPGLIAAFVAVLLVGGLLGGGWYLTRPPPPPEIPPERPELTLAKEHMLYGRHTDAAKQLNTLLAADPDNADLMLLLGRAELGRGKPELAAAALKPLIGTNRGLPLDDARELDKLRKAIAAATAANATKPEPPDPSPKPKPKPRPRPRPKPKPKPKVLDDLSDDHLRTVTATTDVRVRNCFQEHLTESERAQPADVLFAVELRPTGAVKRARFVRKTAGGPGLSRCLLGVARGWKFPPFNQPRILFDHTFAYRPAR